MEIFPGETALAFYTAKNPTDKAIDGIRFDFNVNISFSIGFESFQVYAIKGQQFKALIEKQFVFG